MTKAQQAERQEAIDRLREWIKPGDTVYTILDSVSRSGMSRQIRVVLLNCENGRADALHPNWAVGKALGLRHAKHNGRETDALVVGGCGMDMGFHLVYELSYVLYGGSHKPGDLPELIPDQSQYDCKAPRGWHWIGGYQCLGKGKCPSNYHVNHREQVRCPSETCEWYAVRTFWRTQPGDVEPSTPSDCAVCHNEGSITNPDGPERFDLIHTDGYALRHRRL